MSGPKRSPIEKTATANSAADQTAATTNENTALGTESQFTGPVQDSPFYKSLLTSGTEATSDAYNNAQANQRSNANAAGFNYTDPAAAGATNELAGSEATALGNLPGEAATAAVPVTEQAAGETAQIGETQGQQGEGYFTGGAVPLETAYMQAQSQFNNALMQLPGQAMSTAGEMYAA